MGTLRPKYLLYRHVEPLGEHGAFYCHHHVWYAYAFLTGFCVHFCFTIAGSTSPRKYPEPGEQVFSRYAGTCSRCRPPTGDKKSIPA